MENWKKKILNKINELDVESEDWNFGTNNQVYLLWWGTPENLFTMVYINK